MGRSADYKDKEKIAAVAEQLEKVLSPGDIIVTDGEAAWHAIGLQIGYWGIRTAQKSLFQGKWTRIKTGTWRATHITRYFGNASIRKHLGDHEKVKAILRGFPNASTFSVEPPMATLIPTESYCMDRLAIYAHTSRALDEEDIRVLLEGTLPILGTKYDFGQLANIALNQIAGYPFEEMSRLLDFGARRKVCSVGIAADDAFHRHHMEEKRPQLVIPRPFSKLNPSAWTQEFSDRFHDPQKRKDFGKWSIENTYPAMYENTSSHFDGEFTLRAKWEHGVRVA